MQWSSDLSVQILHLKYADVAAQPRGTLGKVNAQGQPVPREQSALSDLNGPGGLPTDFVPYNKK